MTKKTTSRSIKDVVYDTQDKVRAHWAFCDVLRSYGIKTNDSNQVRAILHALDVGAPLAKVFKDHKRTLTS